MPFVRFVVHFAPCRAFTTASELVIHAEINVSCDQLQCFYIKSTCNPVTCLPSNVYKTVDHMPPLIPGNAYLPGTEMIAC